ncbi:hypothetical protein ACLB2K_016215 [Fragaria x ananassa]
MVHCSPNTRSALAKDISAICGSPLTNDLGVYLGMPLIHSKVTAATYANLLLVDVVNIIIAMGRNCKWASAKPKLQVARHMEMLSWIKPKSGTFKLNVDGSRNRNGGIGAGGVIRDHTGVWIGGFMGTDIDLHPLRTIVLNCKTLLQQFDSVQINHIHHKRNTVPLMLMAFAIFRRLVIVIEALLDDIASFARNESFSSSNAG